MKNTNEKGKSINMEITRVSEINQDLLDIVPCNISKLLEKHDITQKDLADRLGISAPSLNDYIKGKTLPPLGFFVSLRNLYDISIDDFLTKTINPDDYTKPAMPSKADLELQSYYKKYLGSYFMYYFDTSNYKGNDRQTPKESLYYGVLYIYESPSKVSKSTYDCVSIMGFENRKDAAKVKKEIDACKTVEDAISTASKNYSSGLYIGDFEIEGDYVYLSMTHGTSDRALAIFNKVNSNKGKYVGGIGTINSVSKGREKTPTVQYLGLSRKPIVQSEEEIHHNLLLGYPTFNVEKEAKELVQIFKNLYLNNHSEENELSDLQKTITIRANMERYITACLENNVFRYGKVSSRDDDTWYHWLLEDHKDEIHRDLI